MSVYVDDALELTILRHGSRKQRARWSRLVADSTTELRTFGSQLGLRPAWLQLADTPLEHFDVTASKRAAALDLGAIKISIQEREVLELAKRTGVRFDLAQLRQDPEAFHARMAPPPPPPASGPHRVVTQAPAGLPGGVVHVGPSTPWANPYRPARRGTEANQAAVDHFRRYLARNPKLVDLARTELAGKNLACTCPLRQPCHADVWLTLVNEDGGPA